MAKNISHQMPAGGGRYRCPLLCLLLVWAACGCAGADKQVLELKDQEVSDLRQLAARRQEALTRSQETVDSLRGEVKTLESERARVAEELARSETASHYQKERIGILEAARSAQDEKLRQLDAARDEDERLHGQVMRLLARIASQLGTLPLAKVFTEQPSGEPAADVIVPSGAVRELVATIDKAQSTVVRAGALLRRGEGRTGNVQEGGEEEDIGLLAVDPMPPFSGAKEKSGKPPAGSTSRPPPESDEGKGKQENVSFLGQVLELARLRFQRLFQADRTWTASDFGFLGFVLMMAVVLVWVVGAPLRAFLRKQGEKELILLRRIVKDVESKEGPPNEGPSHVGFRNVEGARERPPEEELAHPVADHSHIEETVEEEVETPAPEERSLARESASTDAHPATADLGKVTREESPPPVKCTVKPFARPTVKSPHRPTVEPTVEPTERPVEGSAPQDDACQTQLIEGFKQEEILNALEVLSPAGGESFRPRREAPTPQAPVLQASDAQGPDSRSQEAVTEMLAPIPQGPVPQGPVPQASDSQGQEAVTEMLAPIPQGPVPQGPDSQASDSQGPVPEAREPATELIGAEFGKTQPIPSIAGVALSRTQRLGVLPDAEQGQRPQPLQGEQPPTEALPEASATSPHKTQLVSLPAAAGAPITARTTIAPAAKSAPPASGEPGEPSPLQGAAEPPSDLPARTDPVPAASLHQASGTQEVSLYSAEEFTRTQAMDEADSGDLSSTQAMPEPPEDEFSKTQPMPDFLDGDLSGTRELTDIPAEEFVMTQAMDGGSEHFSSTQAMPEPPPEEFSDTQPIPQLTSIEPSSPRFPPKPPGDRIGGAGKPGQRPAARPTEKPAEAAPPARPAPVPAEEPSGSTHILPGVVLHEFASTQAMVDPATNALGMTQVIPDVTLRDFSPTQRTRTGEEEARPAPTKAPSPGPAASSEARPPAQPSRTREGTEPEKGEKTAPRDKGTPQRSRRLSSDRELLAELEELMGRKLDEPGA